VNIYKKIAIGCAAGALFIAGLVGGVLRTDSFLASMSEKSLARYTGEKIVSGIVVAEPDRRDTSLRVIIRVKEIDEAGVEKGREGKLLAILPRDTNIQYGDAILLRGKIVLPEKFETDTGRLFDYPAYLKVRGITAIMRYAEVESLERGGGSIFGTLFEAKHLFERSLERVFVEPQGALAEGILLGERRGLPDELTNAFIISGLIHIVVLSGYNISIVAEFVMRAFAFLPKTFALAGGGFTIILFALMTGGSSTAIRACIMALIAILGRYLNRPSDALRALAAAALLMALWNPLLLLHDPSFILSVIATFGLITISPTVEQKLLWITEKFGLRSIAASTIAVQIYILPALLYMTGILSFVSLPANILALPSVPLAMALSFAAGVLGLVHPLLALVPGFFADLLLQWLMLVAHVATAVPFSSTVVAAFPAWVAVLVYLPLTAFALFCFSKTSRS
jgi:competence protein ComEC